MSSQYGVENEKNEKNEKNVGLSPSPTQATRDEHIVVATIRA